MIFVKQWRNSYEDVCRKRRGRKAEFIDVKPEKFIPQNGQETVWTVPRGYLNHIMLSRRMFPEVTFENSPMEVELKLASNENN